MADYLVGNFLEGKTMAGKGMMWCNVAKKPLGEAITEASKHFHKRYKVWPARVSVNKIQLTESGIEDAHVEGLVIVPRNHLHLWEIPG